jgi:small subunit ribosomal protein S20
MSLLGKKEFAESLTLVCAARYPTRLFMKQICPQLGETQHMANHKSAEKRTRQADRRNEANRRNRSRLRTEIKKLRAAIDAGNREEARSLLGETVSLIDKSIQKGIIHQNAAARYKSRLTSGVNEMSA